MAKSTGIEKVEIFPRQAILRVAAKHLSDMIIRITSKGLDYRGKMMKPYTSKYRELKARGFTKKSRGKYASVKGVSTDRQVFPPNFKLTGRTMGNLEDNKVLRSDKDSWTIGWRGEAAEIVMGNKERGRDIMSGIPERERKKIVENLEKELGKEFKKKLKDITVTVTI